MLDNFLIKLFFEGKCLEAYKVFGAHPDKKGVRFTVYAPHARSVQVVGNFNDWDGTQHYMERYNDGGVWTLYIEGLKQYDLYKYRIETPSGAIVDRADPYAFFSEIRPGTASKVYNLDGYRWHDSRWMKSRSNNYDRNMNIYEANLGSWKMKKEFTDTSDGEFYSYEEMIDEIIPYVKKMGYTHIEVMPLNEFPFDGSWGYQATGYFSATSRYGQPKQLKDFINACHKEGIGVIMDFVPAHFVKDGHGLYQFDGGWVYEYADVNNRYSEWDSVYFDVTKDTVRSFLKSAVHFWAEEFHIDGIRFDAVSNLIYWKGNKDFGTNNGALEFLKTMNEQIHERYPALMTIAEDSTDFPYVTKPVKDGGLGFDYKWDMGWMNDTLNYFKTDFPYKSYNHNLITFSMMYAYNENFILPLSHDEVVHGKCSLIGKMPGDYWRQFAGVRALAMYQICHPGAKLNFMGNEIAQFIEWRYYEGLEWFLTEKYDTHRKHQKFIQALNNVYKEYKALWIKDMSWEGFEWIDADNKEQNVISFIRHGKSPIDDLIVVLNFSCQSYNDYRIGIPKKGTYYEVFNSDDTEYGGSGVVNSEDIESEKLSWQGKDNSISFNIGAIGGVIFKRRGRKKKTETK